MPDFNSPRQEPDRPPERRGPIGRVISVRGSQAQLGLPLSPTLTAEQLHVTVGKFVAIRTGKAQLIGVITDISLPQVADKPETATAALDIIGETKNWDLST